MSYSILVVEDDNRMNEIICDYLEMEGYKVHSAKDGIEALTKFEEKDIDLMILDIMMPKLDGWSVCRRVRQKSDIMIVILSARSEEEDKLMGFELGADEYVTKPFSPKVLVARIKALFNRVEHMISKEEIEENCIKKGELLINKDSYSVYLRSEELRLTIKEFELLSILTENDGKAFTREVLINRIWGYEYYGDGRVVDTSIKTLRKKLGDYASNIVTVIGVGYKFEVKV